MSFASLGRRGTSYSLSNVISGTAIHPSKHPSQRSDVARQNGQGATQNSVNIDRNDDRRPMTTDPFPFYTQPVGGSSPSAPTNPHRLDHPPRPLGVSGHPDFRWQ
jgi:hypothetical protein